MLMSKADPVECLFIVVRYREKESGKLNLGHQHTWRVSHVYRVALTLKHINYPFFSPPKLPHIMDDRPHKAHRAPQVGRKDKQKRERKSSMASTKRYVA